MATPTVLTRLLDRLPEFYKQEGTYNEEGFTETGRLFYNNIDEVGILTSPDLEINTKGRHLEVDLLITGHTNYKLGSILVQEEKRVDSIISEVTEAHQVDNVDGVSLDRLAKIFDLSRASWADDELRSFLKSAVTGLIGGGTTPNLKTAVALMTGVPETNIKVTDSGLANILIEVPKKYEDVEEELKVMIEKYKPAGVSYTLTFSGFCKWDIGKWDECVWS